MSSAEDLFFYNRDCQYLIKGVHIAWAGEAILIIPRAGAEAFLGILVRHGRLIISVFVFVVLGALSVASILRPIYTATALLVVEPVSGSLLDGGPRADVPGNPAVDGMVEIMRSEPVLTRAVEIAAPFELADFATGLDLQPGFLGFFRLSPDTAAPGEAGRAQVLKVMRGAVAINRRGLTPVIAISAKATSPQFAARLADAVGEAQIALDLAARTETLRRARDLVNGQADGARDGVLAHVEALEILREQEGDASIALQSGILAAEQDLAQAREQYRRLLQRVVELDEQMGLQMPGARLAAPASPPLEASFPDLRTTLAISGLFGLGLGVALAFTLDGFASGVRSAAELAEAVGVPTAVAMPRVNMLRFDGTSHADQVVSAPLSAFSEGMRTLQVNVQRHLSLEAGGQVVFVLSPEDGAGKTTTALGLARAFDAVGRTVLLLDADVRSAALHRHVDVPLSGGFEQVLTGEVDIGRLAAMVRKDPLSGLAVLVNSDRSTAPAEVLFGRPIFASILRSVRASYDVTVVDMPSLHWSAEAAYILPHADALVVVASWGRTEREKLREALAAIRQAHPAPVPVVPVLSLQPPRIAWPAPRYEPGYSAR